LTTLALYEDLLGPGESLDLPAGNRVVYVASGAASGLGPNEAWFGDEAVKIEAGDEGATLLRWELTEWAPDGAKLDAHVDLDPWAEYLIRCDRVDFPPGGVAYLHTHQGPGIRCLLKGELTVETEGEAATHGPFGAWFEAGPHPVLATASETQETAFVRCMVLPRELEGRSSIRYVRDEDADKPKPQRYTVFLDAPIAL
jgi:hypothetical protein